MKKRIFVTALTAGILCSTPAFAEIGYQGTSIGGEIGIFGLGANLKGKFSDTLGVRVGFDKFTYNDYEVTDGEVQYNFDVDTQDFLATLDWHPYGGSFKASGGMIVNNSKLNGTAKPVNNTFTFNDVVYSTDDIATVYTKGEFDPVAPYIGIGWDTSWEQKSGFGFTFDLGVIYQGSAKVDYNVEYTSSAAEALIAPSLEPNLEAEKQSLQNELDKYQFLPYIAIGINYKF